MISRADLFERLAGPASGITVVTPNRRPAQALNGAFDAFQAGRGLAHWEAPDILPFAAFVSRLYDESFYLGKSQGEIPLPLQPAQEEQLWRQTLEGSREGANLLALGEAAARCREAWNLAHAW